MTPARRFSLHRLLAIGRKELLHIIRDLRNLFLVTISPAFLLFLLAYIFSFEVTRLDLAVMDMDRSPLSRRYLESLSSSREVVLAYSVDSYEIAEEFLVDGSANAVLVIPPGFGEAINRGRPAPVQAVVDGADPLVGREVVNLLAAQSSAFVLAAGSQGAGVDLQPVEVRTRAWYNAGLESLLSMVPGLLSIVLTMPTLALALALTREKESGTLEGLMATPVSGLEYLAGKLLAYVATGLVSAILAWLVAVLWFKVPFRGSLAVYLLLAGAFFLACMGATAVIANFVRSQQTAMFIVLVIFIVPGFFLAGLINPVSRSSLVPMLTSYALPGTHFVEISRTVFLKGLGLPYLVQPALILLGMGVGSFLVALRTFRKRIG
ncbi:MAG: ABC transporter permease [Anaerolineae bacterium]|jgi:ABC-2 type transport system permease protein|nr:ABC transporter permease [Anaerolineae bacterium]